MKGPPSAIPSGYRVSPCLFRKKRLALKLPRRTGARSLLREIAGRTGICTGRKDAFCAMTRDLPALCKWCLKDPASRVRCLNTRAKSGALVPDFTLASVQLLSNRRIQTVPHK